MPTWQVILLGLIETVQVGIQDSVDVFRLWAGRGHAVVLGLLVPPLRATSGMFFQFERRLIACRKRTHG